MKKAYQKPTLHEQTIMPSSLICDSSSQTNTRVLTNAADNSEVLIKRRGASFGGASSSGRGSLWDDNE